MAAAVRSGLPAGVERRSFSTMRPRSPTTPAATLVPPTSTPIVRLMRGFFRRFRRWGLIRARRRRSVRARRRLRARARLGLLPTEGRSLLVTGARRRRLPAGTRRCLPARGRSLLVTGVRRRRLPAGTRGILRRRARRGVAAGARARRVRAAVPAPAPAGRRQGRFEDRHGILDYRGDRVADRGHPLVPPGFGLPYDPG